jgi:hypothetical protein
MTHAELYAYIAKHHYSVLGTAGPGNKPQSAVVGIAVTPQLEIVFDTVKTSRKYPNLIERPHCSFVVGGWDGAEQTVQYEGIAQELEGTASDKYLTVYFATFPDGPSRLSWPGIVHFLVRPTWIRYSDFDQSPPLIREFRFGSDILGDSGSSHIIGSH